MIDERAKATCPNAYVTIVYFSQETWSRVRTPHSGYQAEAMREFGPVEEVGLGAEGEPVEDACSVEMKPHAVGAMTEFPPSVGFGDCVEPCHGPPVERSTKVVGSPIRRCYILESR